MKQHSYFLSNILLFFVLILSIQSQIIHHELKIRLIPQEHRLVMQDEMTWATPVNSNSQESGEKSNQKPSSLSFLLHSQLEMQQSSMVYEKLSANPDTVYQPEINAGLDSSISWTRYRAVPDSVSSSPSTTTSWQVAYQGSIHHAISPQAEEYARSFSETPGIICPQGVYLSGASGWYPRGTEKMLTFTASIQVPRDWNVVCQGQEIKNEIIGDQRLVIWQCQQQMEEIYLVAGPWHSYRRQYPSGLAVVHLRQPDPALAQQYLTATDQYLRLYRDLIGPYPYSQFTLVENFWETGYGMPSFTLLGSKVIRFPFILQSSYPHEILHNWWGNGVLVQYDKGNWCEGLTAYLADHLIKEIQGQGAEYRRSTLQKYRDFVQHQNDFPLRQFQSRHSPATEAIGYGKSLMLFHELRQRIGDAAFTQGLQQGYRQYFNQYASFEDWQAIFSKVSGQDLSRFFRERVEQVGAPELEIQDVRPKKMGEQTLLQFMLVQKNKPAWQMQIPIAITVVGQNEAIVLKIPLEEEQQQVSVIVPGTPARLDIDPEFDVWRKLDRAEIPASIGQVLGAPQIQVILANGESEENISQFQSMSQWGKNLQIIKESPNTEFSNSAVIYCGAKGKFTSDLQRLFTIAGVQWQSQGVTIEGQNYPWQNHGFVLSLPHPQNPEMAILWLLNFSPEAIPGLLRKMPHYGKYSYLVFRGNEPENVGKGQWPILHSPLTYCLGPITQRSKMPAKPPLAQLPSRFDGRSIFGHVEFLASEKLQGRGLGTPELDQAAEYIARQFQQMGLVAEYQTWQQPIREQNQLVSLRNVCAIVPGLNAQLQNAPVIVGAHYDHLGLGYPNVKAGNQGKIHPGANDNASGIAVLLELARWFAQNPGQRPIYFVAFTGEEAQFFGSRYFVKNLPLDVGQKTIGMVNLDSIGRIIDGKVLVLNTNSAREWPFIFQGCSYTTGVPITCLGSLESSDHLSFLEARIPAVHIFTGADPYYHSPQDNIGNVRADDMEKVAWIAQEAIAYLANRPEPLTNLLANARPAQATPSLPDNSPARPSPTKTRVSLGVVPDFQYQGKGVQLSDTVPQSSAAKAGLQKGDIVVQIGQQPITTLQDLARILQQYQPGDCVKIFYQRGIEAKEVDVILQQK